MSIVAYEPKHIIIFFDKSTLWIDENQKNYLRDNLTNPNFKTFEIGDNFYHAAQIAKVLTREEYYSEYPEQKLDKSLPTLADILAEKNAYIPTDPVSYAKKPSHIESMIRVYERAKYEIYGTKWDGMKAEDGLYQRMIKKQKDIALAKDKENYSALGGDLVEDTLKVKGLQN